MEEKAKEYFNDRYPEMKGMYLTIDTVAVLAAEYVAFIQTQELINSIERKN